MRLPVRLAVAATLASVALAPDLGAQRRPTYPDPYPTLFARPFSVATEDFFTGTVNRVTFWGCQGYGYSTGDRTDLCVTSVFESGIERATGQGAARGRVTEVSGYARQFAFGYGGASLGRVLVGSTWEVGSVGIFPLSLGEGIRRAGPGDATRWETYVPDVQDPFGLELWYIEADPMTCGSIPNGCHSSWSLFPTRVAAETVTLAPEPSTWTLLGTGLLTLGGIAARRRKRAGA